MIAPNLLFALVVGAMGIADFILAKFFIKKLLAKNPKATEQSIKLVQLSLYSASAIILVLACCVYHFHLIAKP